ncbi:hypothetical protein [Pedobacter sp. MC2016-24]|uniref:hypothetical protein n=1 Tax=Pedobacter sp. MC2016-24 TaxID=2780090 RepID=UPI00187F668E|nr:hypothetical protein [Pedobacter sp. MC2016-24]MBE9599911.1 hypothetical protein [Pedobacter sp. MC2016-24]
MKKLFNKVDRIRATGMAVLKLQPESPYFKYADKNVTVIDMGIPDFKCRVTVLIQGEAVDLTIEQVY